MTCNQKRPTILRTALKPKLPFSFPLSLYKPHTLSISGNFENNPSGCGLPCRQTTSIVLDVARACEYLCRGGMILCGLIVWVTVQGFNLSYYIGLTILMTIYTHYDNLI